MDHPPLLTDRLAMTPASHALLIVPPFANICRPALGVHVLQSVARAQGLRVDILYANLIFASLLGENEYESICNFNMTAFLGERIMAWLAFGAPPPELDDFNRQSHITPPLDHQRLRSAFDAWQQQTMEQVCQQPYTCIGVSSTFEQTNASLVLLRACRKICPEAKLLIGGANCEDVMAEGIAAYMPEVDPIFSGESELIFSAFLSNPEPWAGQKIIRSQPNEAISELPENDYSEYRRQFAQWLPASELSKVQEIAYESSRGCWWGQKNHCTFCGLNGQGMGFREKSADKVFSELVSLQKNQQASYIMMTDNIMPRAYFSTLLPRLAQAQLGLHIFYEQKANIDLPKAILLKQAGVDHIQPGIEALHTESLKLMKKGIRARQNIALLRYARALNINVTWNLLYGFPGEQAAWFAEVLQHLPALGHLQAPVGLFQINIDRFSPFFTSPAQYGFSNLRPHANYAAIFPGHPDLAKIAYHFCAEASTPTLADSPILPALELAIADWMQRWQNVRSRPGLYIMQNKEDQYILIDSRSWHAQVKTQLLSHAQAVACLVESKKASAETTWALEQGTVIEFDDTFIPLAVADPQIMLRFEREFAKSPALIELKLSHAA